MAVKPLTQFPVHLEEETNLEARYSQLFTGRFTLRTVTVRKAREGLGIMIVEGRHADLGKGIFISGIQSNSPAEQSGLAIGDMILCVDQTDLVRADYETVSTDETPSVFLSLALSLSLSCASSALLMISYLVSLIEWAAKRPL